MGTIHRLTPWRDNGEVDEGVQGFTNQSAVDGGLCC